MQSDGWSRESHPMVKGEFGVFEVFLPHAADSTPAIPHHSKVKVRDFFFFFFLLPFFPFFLSFLSTLFQLFGSLDQHGASFWAED